MELEDAPELPRVRRPDATLCRWCGVGFIGASSAPRVALLSIAHALGIRESSEQPLVEQIVTALRDRELLLVTR